MAFKMKNPSLMKMAKMAGDSRVAMKMKQQDAAMKLKKDPMQMKTDPMKLQTTTDKQRDIQRQGDFARDDVRKKKDERIAEMIKERTKSKKQETIAKKSPKAMKKGSAMKKDDYKKALKNDPKLEKYIANRKNLEKGSAEFGINQHKINTAYYGKEKADKIYDKYREKHNLGPGTEKGKEKAITLNTRKLNKIDNIKDSGRNVELRTSEVDENFNKKNKRRDKKNVKQGGGSKQEIAAADAKLEQAKIDDMQGTKGGRKGIFRNIRTKLANKRKKKSEEKAKSPTTMKKTSAMDMKKGSAMKKRPKYIKKYKKDGSVRKEIFPDDSGGQVKIKYKKKRTKVKLPGKAGKVNLSPGTDPDSMQLYQRG